MKSSLLRRLLCTDSALHFSCSPRSIMLFKKLLSLSLFSSEVPVSSTRLLIPAWARPTRSAPAAAMA